MLLALEVLDMLSIIHTDYKLFFDTNVSSTKDKRSKKNFKNFPVMGNSSAIE